jgi:hypothetical protein
MTSLRLGVLNNGSGIPGSLIAEGVFSGTPPISTWVTVSGLNIAVTGGTVYWIGLLPIGGTLNYFTAVASGGTAEADYTTAQTTLTVSGGSWVASTVGPSGLQGLSTGIPNLIMAPPGR